MSNPIQVNNTDEETVEIPLTEYKAVMEFSVAISEQNAEVQQQGIATQQAVEALTEQLRLQGENQAAMFAALVDAIAGLNIVVNVPEQPAPQITVNVPQQPAPKVTVQEPADKPIDAEITFKRNASGQVTGGKIKGN